MLKMYDPDQDYQQDGSESIPDAGADRFADMFVRSIWCMRCGVQLDRYTWAVVTHAVFCQTCVADSPYRCLDSIVCLTMIPWDGIMKVAHGLLWLSPNDPVYEEYNAQTIAIWNHRENTSNTFFGNGPFKGRREQDLKTPDVATLPG